LFVCPQCIVLEPKETQRVQFEFKPNEPYVQLLTRDALLGKAVVTQEDDEEEDAAEAEKEEEAKEEGDPAEPDEEELERQAELEAERIAAEDAQVEEAEMQKLRQIREASGRRWKSPTDSHHCLWKIPVCVYPVGQREPGYNTRYLAVRTCTVPHVITVSPTALNFREVTVGERVIRRITVRNMTPSQVQSLHMESLPQNASFTVLNAMSEVSDGPFQIVVEFCPQFAQVYQTTLRVYTDNTRVIVPLKGKGVRPVLAIEPDPGIVDFGAVVFQDGEKDYITQEVQIKNESPYEMGYSLDTVLASERNHFGVQPFTVTPGTSVVAGNGTQAVQVRFQPHRPCEYYRHKFLVSVPNQPAPTYFSFYGMCFAYQMYCVYDKPAVMLESIEKESAFTNQVKVGGGEETAEDRIKKFELEFEKQQNMDDEPRPLNLVIGACVPPQTKGTFTKGAAGGKFEFEWPPAGGGNEFARYFTVEPKAGQVNAGERVTVAFNFTPPKERDLTVQGLRLDLLDDIGQWVSATVKGKLSGGSVPPGQPEVQEVHVQLRAYLCQL
jgi:hypothetical protein